MWGEQLTLAGWAARRRDHGGLVFVDLRDRTGSCSSSSIPSVSPAAAELAKEIRNEFVLRATGEVVARSPETVNPKMPTGEVELQVDELEIVSRSTPLPFQLDEEGVDETLRLRYRWLDLRSERMQRNLALRARLVVGDPPVDGATRVSSTSGRRVLTFGDARGRTRLPRPGPAPARNLLRPRPVARSSSSRRS